MKSISTIAFGSRAVKMLAIPALIVPLLFSSCEKKEPGDLPVTEEDAVEIAIQTLSHRNGGLVQQSQIALIQSITNMVPENCGTTKDTVITKQADSVSRSYKMTLNWNRAVTCKDGKPSVYAHTFNGTSTYSTPKMTSDDVVKGSFSLRDFSVPNAPLLIDHIYERSGTQQSKINGSHSFSSKIKIVTTGVTLNTGTGYLLSGGGGTFSFTGTGADGTPFSFAGTITFQEGSKATLVITGGGTHQISW